jgi:hypothetical protein
MYYYSYIIATCFSVRYDHHQVAYYHDKKLKIELYGVILIECVLTG